MKVYNELASFIESVYPRWKRAVINSYLSNHFIISIISSFTSHIDAQIKNK